MTSTSTATSRIRGVTKPVTFDLEFNGVATDPVGRPERRLQRRDRDQPQGLGPGVERRPESGGVLVSEKIKIVLEIEARPLRRPSVTDEAEGSTAGLTTRGASATISLRVDGGSGRAARAASSA